MESFVFHKKDLVPDNVKTLDVLEEWDKLKEDLRFTPGDKIRNRNKLGISMIVHSLIRSDQKLIGIKCYWWE